MEQNEKNNVPQSKPRVHSMRWKVYLALIALVLGIGVYVFWWAQSTITIREEALQISVQAQQYELLRMKIAEEQSRCENFIAQQEGDFGSFEYCKRFITWSDTVAEGLTQK